MFVIRNILNYVIWYYFFCLEMKNHQNYFLTKYFYLKNQIDDKKHVLEDAFDEKKYYYYLDAIIFTREYLL